jgi:MFS family permease
LTTGNTDTRALIIAITLTTLVQALVSVAVFAPPLLAPAAQADLGVSASAVGIAITLMYVAASLSAPRGGALVARYGPLRVSQQALMWSAGGIALFAFASPVVCVIGAFMLGIGYGPVTPASSTILSTRAPDRLRNIIMSIRQTGVPLGGAIAGALVPSLIIHFGWQAAAVTVAGLCVLMALAVQPRREEYDAGRSGSSQAGRTSHLAMLRLVFSSPALRDLALISFAYAAVQMCFTSYLAVFLTERAGMSLVTAGAVFSAAMIAGIVGRVLWGAVADYVGNARRVLGGLGLLMAACAFVFTLVSPQWPYLGVIGLAVIFGASAIGWNGVFVAEVARIAPAGNIAQATGATLGMTYFVVVGPFIYWLIVTVSASYALAYAALGVCALVAGLACFRKEARQ